MRLTNISIKRFRSIQSLSFSSEALSAICGPNSCGKSNIMRAIKFAFLANYDAARMQDNICFQNPSPNTSCEIILTFDEPTPALVSSALSLPAGNQFEYSVSVKRNGSWTAKINNTQIDVQQRESFLACFLVVHVPPVRDIAADGLKPFKDTLADALKKTRGTAGFAHLNRRVRDIVKQRGKKLLDGTKNVAKELLHVDGLTVDTDGIDLEQLLPLAGLKVRVMGKELALDKLGTGHQSSVILKLYRQLGEETERFVLYLFEEPDNHLHPTSLRAIADELTECSKEKDCQVLLTTHSPYFLNQFSVRNILALTSDNRRLTQKRQNIMVRSDREVRVALGKYGLKPTEALLADKVVVVEGPNDVTLLRTLVELETGISPDRQDIMIVAAGGKAPVADLVCFLRELGTNCKAFFDWDATESTSAPLFRDGLLPSQMATLQNAARVIKADLRNLPTKDSKATKIIDSMLAELLSPPVARAEFDGSILDLFLRKHSPLNLGEMADLKKAIRRHQYRKIAKTIAPKNIWLWSGSIEEVILRSPDAENDAETALRRRGVLRQTFLTTHDRRLALINLLHNSAHEPDLVRDVVETLWRAGRFDHSEIKSATKFILN